MSINPEYYHKYHIEWNGKDIQPFNVLNDYTFGAGNVIKYLIRYKEKGGKEDLEKAITYIDLIIENLALSYTDGYNLALNSLKQRLIEENPPISLLLKRNPTLVDLMELKEEILKLIKDYK